MKLNELKMHKLERQKPFIGKAHTAIFWYTPKEGSFDSSGFLADRTLIFAFIRGKPWPWTSREEEKEDGEDEGEEKKNTIEKMQTCYTILAIIMEFINESRPSHHRW